MNANELAVYMEDITDSEESPYRQAATMLRQQQAEIEALKQIIDANNLSQNIGQFVKPVKELTDEEMARIFEKMFNLKKGFIGSEKRRGYFEFARAILRKAQEK